MNSNKISVLTNIAWRLAERIGAQGVSFVVSVILARLLLPEDYGIVSLITIFTAVLNLFIDSGFKLALIQKKKADQLDFSTVFYFNIIMGVLLYAGMFLAAPRISVFYDSPHMTLYIRVMSLTLVLGAVNGVQQAVVSIRMEFKRFFYATLGGTVFSAFLGIFMAYHGMGVWAIIVQRLSNQCIDTIILWATVRWRPTLEFSLERLKPMFRYSSKILASSVMDTFTGKLTNLLIGKYYSAADLAYYEKGDHIPALFQTNLQTAVSSVLMPVMSKQQDFKESLKKALHRSIMVSSYLMFPCMVGLAACSGPLVRLLYTVKWSPMIPYMQLMCFSYMFWLVHVANLQVIQATGRSDVFLKIEIIKQTVDLTILLVTIRFGVMTLVIGYTIESFVAFFINAYPNKELANYGCWEQLKNLTPMLLLSLIMGFVVYSISFLQLSDILMLIIQFFVGVLIYWGGSVLLKLESYQYILKTVKEILHKNKK